jgi:hypothetical protein
VASRFLSVISPEIAPEPKRADSRSRVERRAIEIDDPVERLRYLRRAMTAPAARKRRRGSATLALLIVPLLVGLTPAPIHSVPSSQLPRRSCMRTPRPHRFGTTPTSPTSGESRPPNPPKSTATVCASSSPTPRQIAHARDFRFTRQMVAGPRNTAKRRWGSSIHTTESHLAPFEEEATRRLKQLGPESCSRHCGLAHSYHYLVDRFGECSAWWRNRKPRFMRDSRCGRIRRACT